MATNDGNPLGGASLLDLGLDEVTAPDDGQDGWAAAGRALVDRVGTALREQREANELAAQREREDRRPLSERYDYQFEQDGPQPEQPEQTW